MGQAIIKVLTLKVKFITIVSLSEIPLEIGLVEIIT